MGLMAILVFMMVALSGVVAVEYLHFDNFLFSTFGINPAWLAILGGLILAIWGFRKGLSWSVILFVLGLRLVPTLGLTIARAVPQNDSYITQLENKHGQVVHFLNFVGREVYGRILIPPESLPWKYTGNSQFVKSWVYPVAADTYSQYMARKNVESYDYVIISSETSESGPVQTWPDFPIKSEKIIIYDWETDTGEEIDVNVYDPKDWAGKQPWGLIKVDKD